MSAVAERELTEEQLVVVSLIERAQAGDRDAFGALVERFQRAVRALAYRKLGNEAEAHELTQEVFIQALRKLHQLRQPECFGGWLRSMTVRLAVNRLTRKGRVQATEPEALDARAAERETPVAAALVNEQRAQVQAGLARLGRMDRETLVAFYVDGRSLAEMSADFRSPVGTIKRRLHVARKRLARELEEFAAA